MPPPLRTTATLVSDGARVQVGSTNLPAAFRPNGWQHLSAWQDEGWVLSGIHGNVDRDAILLFEQHWGDPMRLSAVVTAKEKEDGTIKFKAVTDDVPGIPDDWDKGIMAWAKAGWELVDITGNREHGAWWRFVKTSDEAES